MYQIDIMSRKPVYEQLVDQVERFILRGVLLPEQQMQSVRSLSMDLAVNPNTVQKAYSELDRRGIVYSVPGKGCFVSPEAMASIGKRKRGELHLFTRTVQELALAGIAKAEVISCVEEAYREEDREELSRPVEAAPETDAAAAGESEAGKTTTGGAKHDPG